ncbi:MAG: hypothetical protein ACI87W_003490, partial [Halieaceae bacterium]
APVVGEQVQWLPGADLAGAAGADGLDFGRHYAVEWNKAMCQTLSF